MTRWELVAEQDIRTGRWTVLDQEGEPLFPPCHRHQVEGIVKEMVGRLSVADPERVTIVYRHARKGTVKKAKES